MEENSHWKWAQNEQQQQKNNYKVHEDTLPGGSALSGADNQRVPCKELQRNVIRVGELSCPFSLFLMSMSKRNICNGKGCAFVWAPSEGDYETCNLVQAGHLGHTETKWINITK